MITAKLVKSSESCIWLCECMHLNIYNIWLNVPCAVCTTLSVIVLFVLYSYTRRHARSLGVKHRSHRFGTLACIALTKQDNEMKRKVISFLSFGSFLQCTKVEIALSLPWNKKQSIFVIMTNKWEQSGLSDTASLPVCCIFTEKERERNELPSNRTGSYVRPATFPLIPFPLAKVWKHF